MDTIPPEILQYILRQTHYEVNIFVCRLWREIMGERKRSRTFAEYLVDTHSLRLLQWGHEIGAPFSFGVCLRACAVGRLDMVMWYVNEFAAFDPMGACCYAMQSNNLELIEYLIELALSGNANKTANKIKILRSSVTDSCLEVMKRVIEVINIRVPPVAVNATADKAPLENLIYLVEKLAVTCDLDKICQSATRGGKLDTIVYFSKDAMYSFDIWSNVVIEAMTYGKINVLDYAYQMIKATNDDINLNILRDYILDTYPVMEKLDRDEYVPLLQWCHEHQISLSYDIIYALVRKRDLETLKLYYHDSYVYDHHCLADVAIEKGYCEFVEWLLGMGSKVYQLSQNICDRAIASKDVNVLKWLYERGARPSANTCMIAALTDNLEMVQWCYETYKLADSRYHITSTLIYHMIERAIASGHVNILEWIFSLSVQGERVVLTNENMNQAISCGHFDVVLWLHEKGLRFDYINIRNALTMGSLELIEWLYEHGGAIPIDACHFAALNKDVSILEWVYAHGFIIDSSVIDTAWANRNIDVILWLRQKNLLTKEEK